MINADTLAIMKKGAILLNLSRGNVVVIEDLQEALLSKQISGAAIDVFPSEPEAVGAEFLSPLQGLKMSSLPRILAVQPRRRKAI